MLNSDFHLCGKIETLVIFIYLFIKVYFHSVAQFTIAVFRWGPCYISLQKHELRLEKVK